MVKAYTGTCVSALSVIFKKAVDCFFDVEGHVLRLFFLLIENA